MSSNRGKGEYVEGLFLATRLSSSLKRPRTHRKKTSSPRRKCTHGRILFWVFSVMLIPSICPQPSFPSVYRKKVIFLGKKRQNEGKPRTPSRKPTNTMRKTSPEQEEFRRWRVWLRRCRGHQHQGLSERKPSLFRRVWRWKWEEGQ